MISISALQSHLLQLIKKPRSNPVTMSRNNNFDLGMVAVNTIFSKLADSWDQGPHDYRTCETILNDDGSFCHLHQGSSDIAESEFVNSSSIRNSDISIRSEFVGVAKLVHEK